MPKAEFDPDKIQQIVDSMCSYVDEMERMRNLFDELNTVEQKNLFDLVMMHGNSEQAKKMVNDLFVKYKGSNFLNDQCLERMGYSLLMQDYDGELQK